LADVAANPGARLRHYFRGIVGEWAAVVVVAVIGLLAHRGGTSIGLRGGPHAGTAVADVVGVAIVLAISAVLFRLGGETMRELLRRQARGFEALLPRTKAERVTFAGLAITAGICEEIIFRGFGIAYVHWVWPSATRGAVITVTAVAFGLVHLYQGPRGVILTGLVGAYLAWVTLSTGSLLPAIAMHALLDLRILALPDLDPRPDP
jgi:membrane protease YdiL (CAAX protease family)